MSKFSVDIRKISKVWDHSNADKLSLASVEGMDFQFVTGKDAYKVGDFVVYFPVDSILPERLQEAFGLTGKLSGKKKNRLNTVKLRGELSQGFVAPLEEALKLIDTDEKSANEFLVGLVNECIEADDIEALYKIDLSEVLGVEKYEQPPIPCHAGNLVALPSGVSMYDIEGVERYPEIVEKLMGIPVIISEKLEGQNYGVTSLEGEIVVNQRKHAIEPIEGKEHDLHRITKELQLDKAVEDIRQRLGATQVTLRGEYLGPGVQKNLYKLQKNTVRLFDILVDGRYLSAWEVEERCERCETIDKLWVPIIAADKTLREWLAGRTIVEASHGDSLFGPTIREGIVIKPMVEQEVEGFGRLIVKKRDPIYLAKYGF